MMFLVGLVVRAIVFGRKEDACIVMREKEADKTNTKASAAALSVVDVCFDRVTKILISSKAKIDMRNW